MHEDHSIGARCHDYVFLTTSLTTSLVTVRSSFTASVSNGNGLFVVQCLSELSSGCAIH